MFPNNFKISKQIDFDKLMKNYIIKNYDINSYTEKVQQFITEYQQCRNLIILLNEKDKTYDSMKTVKENLINYLTNLNLIKSKMNFGKDDFSIKVDFAWRDVVKNDFWYSNNVNFEYYSCLFNLAIAYSCLGSCILPTEDEVKLKEGIKYFQFSSWLFDNIKNELPSLIPAKETPIDMSQNYLTYCSYLCLAQAQTYLLTVAERKKSAFELQAQLAKGVFDLYTQAYQLANESLKKIVSEESKILINNRRFYYVAISFIKMKDSTLEEFNKTGEGYGKSIAYLGLACDSLNQGYKDIKKIKTLFDIQAYEDFKLSQEKIGQEMLDKNSRIYIQAVPDLGSLPKLDKKIMVSPQQIPDNLNIHLEGENSVLDALVPREVKGMIENYKRSMMEYISENLNKYQSEADILKFLSDLDLPYSLETVLSQNEISESLWKNINEVQQKGGSMFLTNNITNLEKKGEEILRRINDMLQVLTNEEDEDTKFKTLYDTRWNRTPSNQLNYQYTSVLREYQKKLEIAKNCDGQIKLDIMDHMKFFELLGLSKSSLSNKIPKKTDVNAIKNCDEALTLRKDLDTMDVLKEKCMEVINRIFQSLNEDNMVPQFIKVLQKKSTEKQILGDNKPKYEAMFKELEVLSEEIKILKLSITAKNEVFLRVKQNNFKTCDENEKFFRELEDYCKLYNQKLVNLQQGINFYTEFNRRLNDINGHITDFLVSRDIEKNDIIKHITSGGALNYNNVKSSNPTRQPQSEQKSDVSINSSSNQFPTNTNYWDFTNTNTNKNYLNQSSFLDPQKNLITNLGTGFGQNPNSNMINMAPGGHQQPQQQYYNNPMNYNMNQNPNPNQMNFNMNPVAGQIPNQNQMNNMGFDFNNMGIGNGTGFSNQPGNNYNNMGGNYANINRFTNPGQGHNSNNMK